MTAPAIRVEGLGKEYTLGVRERAGVTMREAIVEGLGAPFRRLGRKASDERDAAKSFWALKDVSFEIAHGDVVGIIGRNGAGKSTLLKILSRITAPTTGRVEVRGRIASLLEVGTGFHPELTGRENIRLNGAILGMSSAEVRAKLDEIVEFAGVEKFIDTPVKRYSSGMQMRLAFAVAAHLEPEILVVDEVLAVGDAEFQKKCLGKMGEIAGHGGRTVLFVSHNMAAVQSLCRRGIFLDSGRVAKDGAALDTLAAYMATGQNTIVYERPEQVQSHEHAIMRVNLGAQDVLGPRMNLLLTIASRTTEQIIVNIRFKDLLGSPVAMATLGGIDPQARLACHLGEVTHTVAIDMAGLAAGRYSVSIDIERPFNDFSERLEDCVTFSYVPEQRSDRQRTFHQDWRAGWFLLDAEARVVANPAS